MTTPAKTHQPIRRDQDGYATWVRLTDRPLLGLAVVFLVVFSLPYAVDLSDSAAVAVTVANLVIWAVFAVDYLARVHLALDRREYVRRHVLDLLIVVLPFLRPLRVLRLLRLGVIVGLIHRRSGSFHARMATYVGASALTILVISAVAMYDTERNADGANIESLSDALWWAVSTVMTVGYGDRYPTTGAGRLIAVALMLVGVALLGVITASIAAWFVQKLRPVEEAQPRDEASLTEVLQELQRLHARLDVLTAHDPGSQVTADAASRRSD